MVRHLNAPLSLSQASNNVFETCLFKLSAHPIPELADKLFALRSEAISQLSLSSELFLRLL